MPPPSYRPGPQSYFLALIAAVLVMPAMPDAAPADRIAGIDRAWKAWVARAGVGTATLAILHEGTVMHEAGIGADADRPMPLASLTKVITAACIADLVAKGDLMPGTQAGDLLPAGGPAATVTVAQLLTHSGGIWPDATQGNAALAKARIPATRRIALTALDRPAQGGEIGTFAYNNENYAILGAMIEAVTGRPYAPACGASITRPLGLRAPRLAANWAAHGAWGGLAMPAADFSRVIWNVYGPGGRIGAQPQDWPHAPIGDGAFAAMGVLWRPVGNRDLFWTTGMLCWDGAGNGGYAASYGGGWVVVTLYAACLDGTDDLRILDDALFRATVL